MTEPGESDEAVGSGVPRTQVPREPQMLFGSEALRPGVLRCPARLQAQVLPSKEAVWPALRIALCENEPDFRRRRVPSLASGKVWDNADASDTCHVLNSRAREDAAKCIEVCSE